MPGAWRIVKQKHAATAFSGKGAAEFGGRWNSRGIPMVYTSGSASLAALEILVHLNPPIQFSYVIFPLTFNEPMVEKLNLKTLPRNWRISPPATGTQKIGDRWTKEARSVVLEIPSVVIEGESNYLLNPNHPDFSKILIDEPWPFTFDRRLLL